jgi:hypothetical protein
LKVGDLRVAEGTGLTGFTVESVASMPDIGHVNAKGCSECLLVCRVFGPNARRSTSFFRSHPTMSAQVAVGKLNEDVASRWVGIFCNLPPRYLCEQRPAGKACPLQPVSRNCPDHLVFCVIELRLERLVWFSPRGFRPQSLGCQGMRRTPR